MNLRFLFVLIGATSLCTTVFSAPKAPVQKPVAQKPKTLEEQLQAAVNQRNYSLTKSLLQRGVSTKKLKDISSLWELVLWHSDKKGGPDPDLEFVDWMLKAGIDWNPDAIDMIVNLENSALFDVFLANGTKINGVYRFTQGDATPLIAYLQGPLDKPGFLRYLIDAGSDVNIVLKSGERPLQYASDSIGDTEFLKILLEAGAKPKPDDSILIERAAEASDGLLLGQLITMGVKIPMKANLLHQICKVRTAYQNGLVIPSTEQIAGRIEGVRLLLKSGASINSIDSDGKTPLMYAMADGLQPDLVEFLLKNGANPLPKTKTGNIWEAASPLPFHQAWQLEEKPASKISTTELIYRKALTSEESTRTLELLLNARVPIDLPDAGGETILMKCAELNRTKSIKFLLSRGAKLEIRDHRGETALQKAVLRNSPEAALVLIAGKANIETTDNRGNTPLLNSLDYNGTYAAFPVLMKSGANVNARNKNGSTPLLQAFFTTGDNSRVVRELLEKGANPNVQQKNGESPLLMAIMSSDVEMARHLVKAGANTKALFQKKTMLQWAKTPSYGELQLIEIAKSPRYKKQSSLSLEAYKERRREMIQLLTLKPTPSKKP